MNHWLKPWLQGHRIDDGPGCDPAARLMANLTMVRGRSTANAEVIVRRNMLSVRILLVVVVSGLAAAQVHAADSDGDFARRCDALAAQARFSVVFEDRPITRDDTRTREQLRNISQLGGAANHHVYGLTFAQARIGYAMQSTALAAPGGAVCVVPNLSVTLGLADLTVYLARELTQPCRRAVVEEHEQEHVAVWRSHLRAGARLLEPVLRQALARPFQFASMAQAQSGLRQQIDAALAPLTKNLQDGILQANRDIDSPASYQAASRRLDTCP